MALKSKNGLVSGKIGQVIYYELNGRQVMRAVPRKYKQTKASKISAKEFGKASTMGNSVRMCLGYAIPSQPGIKMQSRLVSVLRKWLQTGRENPAELVNNLEIIKGFQFVDQGNSLWSRWKIIPEIDFSEQGMVHIKVPAFIPKTAVEAPPNTASVTYCFTACSINIKNPFVIESPYIQHDFDYNSVEVPEHSFSFKVTTEKEHLILAGASLTYHIQKNGHLIKNENSAYMPSAIIDAATT